MASYDALAVASAVGRAVPTHPHPPRLVKSPRRPGAHRPVGTYREQYPLLGQERGELLLVAGHRDAVLLADGPGVAQLVGHVLPPRCVIHRGSCIDPRRL